MIEFAACDETTRPRAIDAADLKTGGNWTEVVIRPFDNAMAPDGAWLQWCPEECIRISPFTYCVLGMLWPALRLVYRRPLKGQKTDYWSPRDR